ncbi:amidoligase family protein [Ileibacterium valens]|uniref:amidoligase family protein n=1 Tax=Ileibacterium valens TaxID=1862668 RepID=UPI0024B92C9C|nr:amidoligase family protein [Ileibacterium valens]
MRNPDKDFIGFLKDYYQPGMKVQLIEMNDPHAPKPGTKGVVTGVDDIGNILVRWENGSSLSLIPKVDKWSEILKIKYIINLLLVPFRANIHTRQRRAQEMKEKTIRQIEAIKEQTIGVEIEMAEITRRKAIGVVADYFGTRSSILHAGGGYDSWTCKDNQGRTWTLMRDVSIVASSELKKAELVTPILTYEDIEDLQEIVRRLRKAGAISNPQHGCGVHIHIGANGHTPATLRNLANIMASHEDLLIGALNLDYTRVNRYAKTVDPDFLERLNRKKPKTMAQLTDLWYAGQFGSRNAHYNNSRYRMLNLHATFTKATVEFRLFQFDNPTAERKGGLHAGQLKAYIQLCLALSQQAKDVKSARSKPHQRENKKFAMRTWLLRLGFIGDEFKTARDVFTNRLDGDTAFRFGRP